MLFEAFIEKIPTFFNQSIKSETNLPIERSNIFESCLRKSILRYKMQKRLI